MGLMQGSNLECENCKHEEFKPEKRVTFHKSIRSRGFNKAVELPEFDTRIVYICANCGDELDR